MMAAVQDLHPNTAPSISSPVEKQVMVKKKTHQATHNVSQTFKLFNDYLVLPRVGILWDKANAAASPAFL